MSARSTFLSRHKFALIIRVFSTDPAGVEQQRQATRDLVDRALALTYNGQPVISTITIAIPSSPAFANYDCGLTVKVLLQEFDGWRDRDRPVFVRAHRLGDQFVDVFNGELNHLARKGFHYLLSISPSVRDYVNDTEMAKVIQACHRGAKFGGLILPQVEGVACGFLGNMWSFLHIDEAAQAGGYHHCARDIPMDQLTFTSVRHPDNKELAIPRKGVEETPLIAEMIRRRKDSSGALPREFLAPILPEAWEQWQLPDKIDGYVAYHQLKVRSKWLRQKSYLTERGLTFNDVRRSVMPGYRLEDYASDGRYEHLVSAIQATGYPL